MPLHREPFVLYTANTHPPTPIHSFCIQHIIHVNKTYQHSQSQYDPTRMISSDSEFNSSDVSNSSDVTESDFSDIEEVSTTQPKSKPKSKAQRSNKAKSPQRKRKTASVTKKKTTTKSSKKAKKMSTPSAAISSMIHSGNFAPVGTQSCNELLQEVNKAILSEGELSKLSSSPSRKTDIKYLISQIAEVDKMLHLSNAVIEKVRITESDLDALVDAQEKLISTKRMLKRYLHLRLDIEKDWDASKIYSTLL